MPTTKLENEFKKSMRIVWGLFVVFGGLGLWLIAMGLEIVPPVSKINGPPYLVACIGVVFFVGGFSFVVRGWKAGRERNQCVLLSRRFPGEWWVWDHPWDPGGVEEEPPALTWRFMLSLTVVSLFFFIPFHWMMLGEHGRGEISIFGVLRFDIGVPVGHLFLGIVDIILVIWFLVGVYLAVKAWREEQYRLRFANFPYSPGAKLEVYLVPNPRLPVEVTLRYVEEKPTSKQEVRVGKAREEARQVLWSQRQWMRRQKGEELPIAFDLPAEPAWSTHVTPESYVYRWELDVRGKSGARRIESRFFLPVYQRGSTALG